MGFTQELPKFGLMIVGLIAFGLVIVALLFAVDKLHARRSGSWWIAAFLGPALIFLLIGLVIPAVRTFVLSFFSGDSSAWVGLGNYISMFTTPEMLIVLRNTLAWVLIVPVASTAFGLLYAILIDNSKREALAKSLMFLPMAISFVGASIIWKFVYAYRPEGSEQIGLLNQLVVWLGGEPQQWLLMEPLNSIFLMVVMIWTQAGFAMVVLSAAIKAIPTERIEAAKLDGANSWQLFWNITVPSIKTSLVVVLVTVSIASLKVFDIVRTMTGGQSGTSVIANEMYNQAFRYGQVGQGSALAVFLFLLVVPLVIYQIRQQKTR